MPACAAGLVAVHQHQRVVRTNQTLTHHRQTSRIVGRKEKHLVTECEIPRESVEAQWIAVDWKTLCTPLVSVTQLEIQIEIVQLLQLLIVAQEVCPSTSTVL